MPRGPKGEKRPGDVIGAAVMVGRIATGEIDETAKTDDGKNAAAVALGRMGGEGASKGPFSQKAERDRQEGRSHPLVEGLDSLSVIGLVVVVERQFYCLAVLGMQPIQLPLKSE